MQRQNEGLNIQEHWFDESVKFWVAIVGGKDTVGVLYVKMLHEGNKALGAVD